MNQELTETLALAQAHLDMVRSLAERLRLHTPDPADLETQVKKAGGAVDTNTRSRTRAAARHYDLAAQRLGEAAEQVMRAGMQIHALTAATEDVRR